MHIDGYICNNYAYLCIIVAVDSGQWTGDSMVRNRHKKCAGNFTYAKICKNAIVNEL